MRTRNSKRHWSACTCTNTISSIKSLSLPYQLQEVRFRMPLVEMYPIHQHTSSPVQRREETIMSKKDLKGLIRVEGRGR